jgi:fucose permease
MSDQFLYHVRRSIITSVKLGFVFASINVVLGFFWDPVLMLLGLGLPIAPVVFGFKAARFPSWLLVPLGGLILAASISGGALISSEFLGHASNHFARFEVSFIGVPCFVLCVWIGSIGYRDGKQHRWHAEIRRGFCPMCGYSLAGLEIATCPECGASVQVKPGWE